MCICECLPCCNQSARSPSIAPINLMSLRRVGITPQAPLPAISKWWQILAGGKGTLCRITLDARHVCWRWYLDVQRVQPFHCSVWASLMPGRETLWKDIFHTVITVMFVSTNITVCLHNICLISMIWIFIWQNLYFHRKTPWLVQNKYVSTVRYLCYK